MRKTAWRRGFVNKWNKVRYFKTKKLCSTFCPFWNSKIGRMQCVSASGGRDCVPEFHSMDMTWLTNLTRRTTFLLKQKHLHLFGDLLQGSKDIGMTVIVLWLPHRVGSNWEKIHAWSTDLKQKKTDAFVSLNDFSDLGNFVCRLEWIKIMSGFLFFRTLWNFEVMTSRPLLEVRFLAWSQILPFGVVWRIDRLLDRFPRNCIDRIQENTITKWKS